MRPMPPVLIPAGDPAPDLRGVWGKSKLHIRSRAGLTILALAILVLLAIAPAAAQICYTSVDMQPAAKTALDNAAQQYFQWAQQSNTSALQQNAEFNLGDILSLNKDVFSGQASTRNTYLLDNRQPSPGGDEFICGIANSPNRVGFVFNNLPAGQYGVVIQDVTGGKGGRVSWILQQSGGNWKIAGLYPKPSQLAGHSGNWYLQQARAYKANGQIHNAWLYYVLANDLLRPFPSMSTEGLDQLYEEMRSARPNDLPSSKAPLPLMVNGHSVNLTDMFPLPVEDNLDLIVKYQASDISDSSKTFQENVAVIKSLVAKYPELRSAFAAVVARAVAPNGQDYGTPLAMKDVK